MLHVHTSYPCYLSLLLVHATCPCLHAACPCPFCMSISKLHVHGPCCMSMSMLHVHVTMLHVLVNYACPCCIYAACPCCLSVLHIRAACPCRLSLMHVHAAWPCPRCMSISMLHVYAQGAYPCPCCMPILYVHAVFYAACPCCILCWLSILIHDARPCHVSMLHVQVQAKSVLHVHVEFYAALHAACPWCFSMLLVHSACPYYISPCCMSMSMSMLHYHMIGLKVSVFTNIVK